MVLTVTSGQTIFVVEWTSGWDLIISVLFWFVTAFELLFSPQQKVCFYAYFGFVFSLIRSPRWKEGDVKGQISDVLYNPPLISSLFVLGKIKSGDKLKKNHPLSSISFIASACQCSRQIASDIEICRDAAINNGKNSYQDTLIKDKERENRSSSWELSPLWIPVASGGGHTLTLLKWQTCTLLWQKLLVCTVPWRVLTVPVISGKLSFCVFQGIGYVLNEPQKLS